MNYLQPGTIVSVPIGPFRHYGLVSAVNATGSPYILSCSSRSGQVAEEPAHIFAGGRDIKVHGFPGVLSAIHVISRARSRIGTKYDLLKWNCEHFVRWAHNLRVESPQLKTTVALSSCLLGLFWLSRK